jgi:hypothetical protein
MSIITLNNRAVRSVTTFGSVSSGSMVFIKKLTASSDSSLSFVNGSSDVVLDSTYKEYLFTFNNMHPSAADEMFEFNGSDDTSSHSYNITKTTTIFVAHQSEGGGDTAIQYQAGDDIAQGTGFQDLQAYGQQDTDNDSSISGTLHLFNPSSTTFVKHFMASSNCMVDNNYTVNTFTAGYFNTTAAITAMRFQYGTGNIDAGDICLYGIL